MSELIFNVRGIFDASTRSGCLQQHGCSAYRIPPYQRGYKWGAETNQPVERLLSDLTKAWQDDAKEYLLQAITVKKVPEGDSHAVLEVIDGQQRLTTLFILLRTLNNQLNNPSAPNIAKDKLLYAIRHENQSLDMLVTSTITSVEGSLTDYDTLKTNLEVAKESRQDNYYLKCAVLRCIHHLQVESKNQVFKSELELSNFRTFVLENVKLMVNAVEPHISGEVIFGNLNTNRVALTETELIKGLLLTRVAREPTTQSTPSYRETLELRIQLGQKWDELHHWANIPEHRSLYFPSYKDGITGLLELAAMQMPDPYNPSKVSKNEENPLFEFFLQLPKIEPVFRLLSSTHARLQNWFTDDSTYNLIGYCLMKYNGFDRQEFLIDCLKCKTHTNFHRKLRKRRRSMLLGGVLPNESGKIDISHLRYEDYNQQITHILLALSAFQSEREGRFNFHAYQGENWSLEHIFPQTPFGKNAELTSEQEQAALEILTQNEGGILSENTKAMIKVRGIPRDKQERDEINALLASEPLLHQIGNLCLLSSSDNSSMGCQMFSGKRRVIRDRIARGSFVPRHTYEVFSKMIVGEDDSLDVWSKQDIDSHQTEIQKRLNQLIK